MHNAFTTDLCHHVVLVQLRKRDVLWLQAPHSFKHTPRGFDGVQRACLIRLVIGIDA